MATGTDVFLSHNWGKDECGRDNHQRVSLINEELSQRGYKTWFDEDKITGNIDEKMAQGIEQTEGVIVFLTRKYHEKVNSNNARDNCKKEFLYASEKKTRLKMVPVIMEKFMLDTNAWNGLVGFNLCREMYVNMSGNLEDRTYLIQQTNILQKELLSKGIQPFQGNLCPSFTSQYYGGDNSIFLVY